MNTQNFLLFSDIALRAIAIVIMITVIIAVINRAFYTFRTNRREKKRDRKVKIKRLRIGVNTAHDRLDQHAERLASMGDHAHRLSTVEADIERLSEIIIQLKNGQYPPVKRKKLNG